MKTAQEVFNEVASHLIRQGAKATRGDSRTCVYRASDGKKCAAGCLIQEQYYTPELEGLLFHEGHGAVDRALISSGVNRDDLPLVRALQQVHDCFPVVYWMKELERVAKQFGLSAEAVR